MSTAYESRILLIDDNPLNNQLLATYLLPCGYTLQIVESGQQGVCKAIENPPDLILLDVMMPDMDGYAVCREIRRNAVTANIPILFITADDSPENHQRAFSAGGNDFITKPVDEVVLKARVENLINLFRARRELEELNRRHVLSQKISMTGHWYCTKLNEQKEQSSFSSQFAEIFELTDALAGDFGSDDFLKALTSETLERERIVTQWESAKRDGGIFRELIVCHINSKKKILRVWVEFQRDGAATYAFGSVQDVTNQMIMIYEEMRLQNQVAENRRYDTLVESSTQLAHELNQPLASIILNVNTLKMFLKKAMVDNPVVEEIIQDVENGVMRAKGVVEQLRTLVNRKPMQIDCFDVCESINEILQLFKGDFMEADIEMELTNCDQPCMIATDKGALQQVLFNIIKNSYESLRANPVEKPLIKLSIAEENNKIIFTVADNGVGIQSTLTSKLFMPFVTTKINNLGLGLAVCKNLINRVGGTLDYVKPESAQGAAFKISISKDYIF